MADYRLYLLDETMAIVGSQELRTDTDDLAVSEAYAVAGDCRAVEVWCGRRMVARVPRPRPGSDSICDMTEAP